MARVRYWVFLLRVTASSSPFRIGKIVIRMRLISPAVYDRLYLICNDSADLLTCADYLFGFLTDEKDFAVLNV